MRRMKLVVSGFIMAGLLVAGALLHTGRAWAFSGGGAGTAGDPYKIANCTELLEISADLAAHYILDGPIDCDGVTFHPIGNSSTPFSGALDGNGNAIENVAISETSDEVGIFGNTDTATITDLRLDNVDVAGQESTGALVGLAYQTTITYVEGRNIVVSGGAYNNVGGLVGQLGGSSLATSFAENVDVTGGSLVGGLVGWAVGPTAVANSYAAGTVDGASVTGGAIGRVGAGPAPASNLYADVDFTNSGSDVVGNVQSGGSVSSSFMASAPYLANSTQPPLDSWDFSSVWYVRPGKYPGLRPHTAPVLLCSIPGSTDTSITASCSSYPLLEGDPHWQLKYGFADDTDRTALTTQAGQSFNVTVPNVLPGTDYNIDFRYVDAVGTSQWGKVVITTTGSPDLDNDNLSNEVEYKAPNNGDGDNDGVKDYTQANVTSFKSFITDKYVTLKTACADNFNTQIGRESSSQKDEAYDYPAGLLGFVIRGCTPGATTPVTVYYYGSYDPADYIARKVQGGTYATISGAVLSAVANGGQQALKVTYSVTDGGALDDDGSADGNIADPVGIAAAPVAAPSTGFGAPAVAIPLAQLVLFASGAATLFAGLVVARKNLQQ